MYTYNTHASRFMPQRATFRINKQKRNTNSVYTGKVFLQDSIFIHLAEHSLLAEKVKVSIHSFIFCTQTTAPAHQCEVMKVVLQGHFRAQKIHKIFQVECFVTLECNARLVCRRTITQSQTDAAVKLHDNKES